MTQSGSPYDNAIAERINGILKHQVGLKQVFKKLCINGNGRLRCNRCLQLPEATYECK